MVGPAANVTENVLRGTTADRIEVGWLPLHRRGGTCRHDELEEHRVEEKASAAGVGREHSTLALDWVGWKPVRPTPVRL